MAKMIVVNRNKVISAHRKLDKLIAKDPIWKSDLEKRRQHFVAERQKRDAEYTGRRNSV